MIYSGINCPFCNDQLRIQMYSSECKDCQVSFMSKQIGYTLDSPWRIFYLTFNLQDAVYHSLIMDLDKPETTIWLNNQKNYLEQIAIKIPQVFPDARPETALSLAKRLHQLIAFS
jgi:hypothetical protein